MWDSVTSSHQGQRSAGLQVSNTPYSCGSLGQEMLLAWVGAALTGWCRCWGLVWAG